MTIFQAHSPLNLLENEDQAFTDYSLPASARFAFRWPATLARPIFFKMYCSLPESVWEASFDDGFKISVRKCDRI